MKKLLLVFFTVFMAMAMSTDLEAQIRQRQIKKNRKRIEDSWRRARCMIGPLRRGARRGWRGGAGPVVWAKAQAGATDL